MNYERFANFVVWLISVGARVREPLTDDRKRQMRKFIIVNKTETG